MKLMSRKRKSFIYLASYILASICICKYLPLAQQKKHDSQHDILIKCRQGNKYGNEILFTSTAYIVVGLCGDF